MSAEDFAPLETLAIWAGSFGLSYGLAALRPLTRFRAIRLGVAGRLRAVKGPAISPFSARGKDITALREAVNAVGLDGKAPVQIVVGPRGIGKSTLVDAAFLQNRPGSILLSCGPSDSIDEVAEKAEKALLGRFVHGFYLTKISETHRKLFGVPPVLVLRMKGISTPERIRSTVVRFRYNLCGRGFPVVIDAAATVMQEDGKTLEQEAKGGDNMASVFIVAEETRDDIERSPAFASLFAALHNHGLADAAFAILGNSAAAFQSFSRDAVDPSGAFSERSLKAQVQKHLDDADYHLGGLHREVSRKERIGPAYRPPPSSRSGPAGSSPLLSDDILVRRCYLQPFPTLASLRLTQLLQNGGADPRTTPMPTVDDVVSRLKAQKERTKARDWPPLEPLAPLA